MSTLSLKFSALLIACISPLANAQECSSIANNIERLNCYDRIYGHYAPAEAENLAFETSATNQLSDNEIDSSASNSKIDEHLNIDSEEVRTLTKDWDLDASESRPAFELRAYKPIYLLVGTNTNRKNNQPISGNPKSSLESPVDIDATEAQFQLSFKSKLWDNFFGDNASLWMGYTQSSRWQIYNSELSRPFRETNYEPEVMLVMKTPFEFAGWQVRMSSVAINHQSNGRSTRLSRSWNRIIGQVGLEKDNTMVLIRPWWRIPEKDGKDDNPNIQDYVGRGELIIAHSIGEHLVSLQARHSLRFGENSRGSAKLDWAIPISGKLKGHLSLFSGYGESLIDFNHRQTMIGAGISLIEWR